MRPLGAIGALVIAISLAGCNALVALDSTTIVGTKWRAISVAGLLPVTGHEPTLEFGSETVTGSAGCNGYGSTDLKITGSLVDGAKIQIGGFGAEAKLCPDAALMHVETAFVDALTFVMTVQIVNGRLILDGVQGQLVFEQVLGPRPTVG